MMSSFKQFLKEDPDEVVDDSFALSYDDADAMTVILFKNCYFYSPTRDYTHEQLFFYIYINNVSSKDVQSLSDVNQNVIFEAIKNKSQLFPYPVKVVGRLGTFIKKKVIKQFNLSIEHGNFTSSIESRIKYSQVVMSRNSLISAFPEVMLARLWTNSRIISFWNYNNQMKSDVYSFLHHMNLDPKKCKYDVDGVVDYANFESGNFNPDLGVDVSKVHTLDPEKKKSALLKMGAVAKNPIDLKTKLLSRGE